MPIGLYKHCHAIKSSIVLKIIFNSHNSSNLIKTGFQFNRITNAVIPIFKWIVCATTIQSSMIRALQPKQNHTLNTVQSPHFISNSMHINWICHESQMCNVCRAEFQFNTYQFVSLCKQTSNTTKEPAEDETWYYIFYISFILYS